MKLTGQVAVVTGASRGIGRAIAEALRGEGAEVMGVSRSGGFDVSREADVEGLFAGLQKLDILVNNAGILTPRNPIANVTVTEWDETMAVNLRGVFLCSRAALRLMVPARSGLIINLSSGAGKRALANWGAYAVSKWGVEGFTKCLAEEVREAGIRVIALNPAGTRTTMRASAFPEEDPMTLKTPEAVAQCVTRLAAGEIGFESGDSLDYDRLT